MGIKRSIDDSLGNEELDDLTWFETHFESKYAV